MTYCPDFDVWIWVLRSYARRRCLVFILYLLIIMQFATSGFPHKSSNFLLTLVCNKLDRPLHLQPLKGFSFRDIPLCTLWTKKVAIRGGYIGGTPIIYHTATRNSCIIFCSENMCWPQSNISRSQKRTVWDTTPLKLNTSSRVVLKSQTKGYTFLWLWHLALIIGAQSHKACSNISYKKELNLYFQVGVDLIVVLKFDI